MGPLALNHFLVLGALLFATSTTSTDNRTASACTTFITVAGSGSLSAPRDR
jgi:hypothetical protein